VHPLANRACRVVVAAAAWAGMAGAAATVVPTNKPPKVSPINRIAD
jgi:hypothetical protein